MPVLPFYLLHPYGLRRVQAVQIVQAVRTIHWAGGGGEDFPAAKLMISKKMHLHLRLRQVE